MISSYIVSLRSAYVKFSDNLARPSLFKTASILTQAAINENLLQ